MGLRHVSFKCLLSQGFRSCKRNSASASVHLILQKGDGKKEKSVRTLVPALTEARSGCSGPATPNRPRASSVAGRAAAPVGSPSLGPGHCTSPALSGRPQLGESPSALKCAPRQVLSWVKRTGERNRFLPKAASPVAPNDGAFTAAEVAAGLLCKGLCERGVSQSAVPTQQPRPHPERVRDAESQAAPRTCRVPLDATFSGRSCPAAEPETLCLSRMRRQVQRGPGVVRRVPGDR